MSDYRCSTHTKGGFLEIPSTDKLCEMIKTKCEKYESLIEFYKKENEKLKDENYKDNELQKMKAQYEQMQNDYYRGFPISEEEQTKIQKWKEMHIIEEHGGNENTGAIGGRFIYKFIPTSIGTIGFVECTCGCSYQFQDI